MLLRVSTAGLFAPLREGGAAHLELSQPLARVAAARRLVRQNGAGFLHFDASQEQLQGIHREVTRLRSMADDLVVLGIGGSSLGGQTLCSALSPRQGGGRVHFLDNVDPDQTEDLLPRLEPQTTAACVITKSGVTVETLAQLMILRRWFRASLGQGEARGRMTFVTDPTRGLLRKLAENEGIRCFSLAPAVGGRFSALTAVGLLPAGFAGIDIDALVAGGEKMAASFLEDAPEENPVLELAAGCLYSKEALGRSALVMMPYSHRLRRFADWFVQLWAESLGKRVDRQGRVVHQGQTPIPAIGATDQHSQLQLFVEGPKDKAVVLVSVLEPATDVTVPDELSDYDEVAFLRGRKLSELLAAERRATRAALLAAEVPVLDVELPRLEAGTLAALLVTMEAACVCVGLAWDIDPFDQPGVESGKRMTLGLLGVAEFAQAEQQVRLREGAHLG